MNVNAQFAKPFIGFGKSINGISIYIGLSEKNTGGIYFNLNYNKNDFGSLISDLKHSSGKINSKDLLTLGINFYLGFSKKK